MTTRAKATNAARRRWGMIALGLGALLAAGCVSFKPKFQDTYKFTITFVDGCPTKAEVDLKNCDPGGTKHDCVRARKGEAIVFEAKPPQEFELQFDPFKRAPIKAGGDGRLSLTVDAPSNRDKWYTFNVLAGSCKPLDPWIIVE